MLKIRLRRTGAKKQPRYRVVVAESSAPRDGAFVEILGWYNPQTDPAQVVINTEKAAEWIKRGAQPSDRVAYLLKQAGLGGAEAPAAPSEEAKPEEAEPETSKPPARTRTPAASASGGAAARSSADQGEDGAAGDGGAAGEAAEVPPSEAPEEEGSAGTASG